MSCAPQLSNQSSSRAAQQQNQSLSITKKSTHAQPTTPEERSRLHEVERSLEAQMVQASTLTSRTGAVQEMPPLPSPITAQRHNKQMAAFVASNQPVCQSSPKLGHAMTPQAPMTNRISDSTCASVGDDTVFLNTPGNATPTGIYNALMFVGCCHGNHAGVKLAVSTQSAQYRKTI